MRKKIRNRLRAISTVKEKIDGRLKGRQHCGSYEKYDTASPTVHADSFMVKTSIEAKECRFVATEDVKGAFLHTAKKELTVVNFAKEKVNMLCDIDKSYEQPVEQEGKNTALCLMLSKALYGNITAAIPGNKIITNAMNYGLQIKISIEKMHYHMTLRRC